MSRFASYPCKDVIVDIIVRIPIVSIGKKIQFEMFYWRLTLHIPVIIPIYIYDFYHYMSKSYIGPIHGYSKK